MNKITACMHEAWCRLCVSERRRDSCACLNSHLTSVTVSWCYYLSQYAIFVVKSNVRIDWPVQTVLNVCLTSFRNNPASVYCEYNWNMDYSISGFMWILKHNCTSNYITSTGRRRTYVRQHTFLRCSLQNTFVLNYERKEDSLRRQSEKKRTPFQKHRTGKLLYALSRASDLISIERAYKYRDTYLSQRSWGYFDVLKKKALIMMMMMMMVMMMVIIMMMMMMNTSIAPHPRL